MLQNWQEPLTGLGPLQVAQVSSAWQLPGMYSLSLGLSLRLALLIESVVIAGTAIAGLEGPASHSSADLHLTKLTGALTAQQVSIACVT